MIVRSIAKRRLALGLSNHFKRLVDAWAFAPPDLIIADADLHNVRIEKSNILLLGPSSSGKTHPFKSLVVPLVIGNATSLTKAGHVDDDVGSLLSKLILAAEGDIGPSVALDQKNWNKLVIRWVFPGLRGQKSGCFGFSRTVDDDGASPGRNDRESQGKRGMLRRFVALSHQQCGRTLFWPDFRPNSTYKLTSTTEGLT